DGESSAGVGQTAIHGETASDRHTATGLDRQRTARIDVDRSHGVVGGRRQNGVARFARRNDDVSGGGNRSGTTVPDRRRVPVGAGAAGPSAGGRERHTGAAESEKGQEQQEE